MAAYEIVSKEGSAEIVECDFIELNAGFFEFYKENSPVQIIKYIAADTVESVTELLETSKHLKAV